MTRPHAEQDPAPLVITLFGPVRVSVDGQPLPRLRSRKALWLLALLALRHDRPVEREWLAGTLWPDADQDQAFASLRVILSELRKALGSQGVRLQSPSRHTVTLELGGADVDVLAFDTAVVSKNLPALARAVALYTRPLLEGCTEEWAPQERRTREEDCLRALQTLAAAAMSVGDHDTAAEYSRRAVALDPWRDAPRRGLMEALARGGDTNAALQVYREFTTLLRSDPKAVPDEETRALYARLRAEARRRAIAPTGAAEEARLKEAPAPVVSGYLPHPLTPLIGREDERLEVAARLRRSRLVTLTGLGGIGKTRLAGEVAAEAVRDFPDGVWLVALEALTEGKQIVPQIASVLGLREGTEMPLLESLVKHLRQKRLLLVLDNCEHLLEPCGQAARHLLRECAGVRILATSREVLGITGETAWAVPSLAVPDLDHLPTGRATLSRVLIGYESAQLFVERAQAVQKTFRLTPENALEVAQVCARLEGIPLAIELAAARANVLTVAEIAARLDDHLAFLAGGSRAGPARQQTLRATLDWSHGMLGASEQMLLRRLSVFAGGWSLSAAEAVCVGDGIEAAQVLDLIASLADKSLVAFEARDTGGRYRFLETVRQYAAERMAASEEPERVSAKHRDWCVDFAEEAAGKFSMPDSEKWLSRLETEHDNLRTALAWTTSDAARTGSGLRLTGALWSFWLLRGYFSEGLQHLRRALEQNGAQAPTIARAKSLYGAGVLSYEQGDYLSAQAMFEQALSFYQSNGNRAGTAQALSALGNAAWGLGDYAAAWAVYEQSLSLHQETGNDRGIAICLHNLANLEYAQGKYEISRAKYEESLGIFRKIGDRMGVGGSLHNFGNLIYALGDLDSAQVLYEESLTLYRELEDKNHIALSLEDHGDVAYSRGDYAAAQSLHEESLVIRRDLEDRRGIAASLHNLGKLAFVQGESSRARSLYRESLALFAKLKFREGVAKSLKGLGEALPEQDAARLWGAAHRLREELGTPLLPIEREAYGRRLDEARAALGEEAFSTAWNEGCALTWEQAAAHALDNV